MVTLTGKVIIGIKGVTTAITAYKTAAAAGATATTALGAAMNATPVGLIATAIALLGSAIIGSLVASAVKGKDAVESLISTIDENRKAAEEATKAIENEADRTIGLMTALENLAGKEEKTATDKATILQIVNELNEAVPELSLAYDEQADSLNMTSEAMKEFAKNMAEVALQKQYIERLSEAYSENARLTKEWEAASARQKELLGTVSTETRLLGHVVTNLGNAVSESEAEIAALEAAINDLYGATEEAADGQRDYEHEIKTGTATALEHRAAILEESKAIGELTKYLDESRKSTGLSAESVLELTEAGYGATIQIDEETGAVRLNEAAYIDLMKAKIQEQLNTATEARRASLQAAVNGEAHAAQLAALGFYDLAKARYAEAKAAREESIEHDANIKALTALQNSVGQYTTTVKSAGGVAKSAAEKASTAFKDALKEIDRALELGEIDQEEYWEKYSELMSEHLKEGTEEWADANHKLLGGQKKLSDEMIKESDRMQKEMSDRLEKLGDEYDKALSDIESKANNMASRIADIDLVGEKEGVFTFTGLETLEAGNEAIKKLNENLDALDSLGISETLLAEIGKMTTAEANAYSEYLLSMAGTSAWDDYMAAWEDRQRLAAETAQNFYKDQLDALETEFTDKLAEELASLSEMSKDAGLDVSANLAAGILANQNLIESAMATVARQIAGFAMPAAAPGTSQGAGTSPMSSSQPLQITITQTLDGRQVAKGTYEFIVEEGKLRGGNLIEG
jgi:hypothetical protein